MRVRMVEVEWTNGETGEHGTYTAPASESIAISLKRNGISSNCELRRVRKFSVEVDEGQELQSA